MPHRRRSPRPAGVLLAVLLALPGAGCSADSGVREPGTRVTEAEAGSLAQLLRRNHQRGGADFVATAPYGDEAVLTLTGDVDFRGSRGRAEVVTSYGGTRPDDTATVWFTEDALWVGERPGLAEALAAAGSPADVLRRPLADGGTAELVDVLARIVLNLGRPAADDPGAFGDGDWTWAGQRSIDGRLTAVFAGPAGRTVAVDAADDLLLQFATPLQGQSFEVTVTLSGHGRRTVDLPAEEVSAAAADVPGLVPSLGF